MAYMITHSLLSAWLRSISENPYDDATQEDSSKEEFLRVLRREPTPTTEAKQNGIDFENLVTDIVNGQYRPQVMETRQEPNSGEIIESVKHHPWYAAADKVANIVRGGQLQYAAKQYVQAYGTEIMLYGKLDALKAGHIYDIKFSKSYERGKYYDSTQHPMYLQLVPEALDFTYLVSNGTDVWTECYRREEPVSIMYTVNNFLSWLYTMGLMQLYQEKWLAR